MGEIGIYPSVKTGIFFILEIFLTTILKNRCSKSKIVVLPEGLEYSQRLLNKDTEIQLLGFYT